MTKIQEDGNGVEFSQFIDDKNIIDMLGDDDGQNFF
jgi:hypothetical protein